MSKKLVSHVPFVTINRVAEASVPFGQAFDSPEVAAGFWANSIATLPAHESEKENLYVVLLNTKLKVIGKPQ